MSHEAGRRYATVACAPMEVQRSPKQEADPLREFAHFFTRVDIYGTGQCGDLALSCLVTSFRFVMFLVIMVMFVLAKVAASWYKNPACGHETKEAMPNMIVHSTPVIASTAG